jgi:hypothetical protein
MVESLWSLLRLAAILPRQDTHPIRLECFFLSQASVRYGLSEHEHLEADGCVTFLPNS